MGCVGESLRVLLRSQTGQGEKPSLIPISGLSRTRANRILKLIAPVSIVDTRALPPIETWRREYNEERPKKRWAD